MNSGDGTRVCGTSTFGGTLNITAGNFNVGGSFAAPVLNLSGGSLGGSGAATFSAASSWTGNGAMSGSGSTTFTGPLALSGNGTGRSVTSRTVNFAGTTTWTNSSGSSGAGNIGTNLATLNNSGTWLDQLSVNAGIVNSFNASAFNNSGSYVKSGTVTTDLSSIKYVNTGTTDVQQGTLVLPSNFANAGKLMGNGTLMTSVKCSKHTGQNVVNMPHQPKWVFGAC